MYIYIYREKERERQKNAPHSTGFVTLALLSFAWNRSGNGNAKCACERVAN